MQRFRSSEMPGRSESPAPTRRLPGTRSVRPARHGGRKKQGGGEHHDERDQGTENGDGALRGVEPRVRPRAAGHHAPSAGH